MLFILYKYIKSKEKMNSKHFIQKIYYIILLYNLEIVLLFCYF